MRRCKNCQNVIGAWPLLKALVAASHEKWDKGLQCPSCKKFITKPLNSYGMAWTIFLVLPLVAWIEWFCFEGSDVLRFIGMLLIGLAVYVLAIYWFLPFED